MGILSYGYKAIKNVKPKAISDATKRFKARVAGVKSGVKEGTDQFQKQNPKSLVTDKQIKKVQKDTSEKHMKKVRKEYLRAPKRTGGRIGFSEGTPNRNKISPSETKNTKLRNPSQADPRKIKKKSGPMSIETAIKRNKRKELQTPMGRLRPRKMGGGRIGYKGGKLVGGQKKIDVAAPFGKITGADFKKLRNKKKVI